MSQVVCLKCEIYSKIGICPLSSEWVYFLTEEEIVQFKEEMHVTFSAVFPSLRFPAC